jgi:signal transduction histidine kinase
LEGLSIRAKLLWIIMLTSSMALVMAGLALITYDLITFKQQRLNDLSTQAEILGAISSAALVFNDAKAAGEYLSALKARPQVTLAIIYDNGGKVFATYQRSDSINVSAPPAEADGHRIEGDDLVLFRHISQGNETIGTLHLRTNLGLTTRLLRFAGIVLLLLISSLLLAMLLSARLQALISKPILEVTNIARLVIDHQDYSHRAVKHSKDEVGVLVDAFNQMLTQIQQREAALQKANQALQLEIADHKSARAQVAALNETLEQRVAERTAELEAANRELESFCYSVSHDLRAPLRGIDGFTTILQESHGDKLDQQAKNYLQRVRAATQRMGHLIDDLLKLSRTVRSEMNPTTVNLSELAQSIANDLQETAPDRRATFSIAPDMIANADAALIRAVLENLLGNAWKFTGKRTEAQIEVGSTVTAGQTTYFVRDNGTGFDMKYADKLFGAFQRLHSISEFEGTGVGLANVQRIIRRHGGQVWADAKLDEGATFYFTLSAWRKTA